MNKARTEQIVSLVAAGLIVFGCLIVLRPFVSSLLWAGILCFSTWPVFLRLKRALGDRRTLAAGLMVSVITLLVVAPFVVAGARLADNFAVAIDWLRTFKQAGLPPPPDWVRSIPLAGESLSAHWVDLSANTGATMDLLKELLVKSNSWILQNSLLLLEGILRLCLSVLISFFFYRDGEAVVEMITAGLHKVAGDDTQHLLHVVGSTVKGVVYGILCTALAQGVLAGIGFKIAGLHSSLLLGALTFVFSFIPFGPPLVWIPVAIWLFVAGHPGAGVFMLLWGMLVVSGVDNFIKPYVISRDSKQSFALILLGVLGGIMAFGFIGLFIGPTLLAVGSTLVRQFIARKRARPAAAGDAAAGGP